MARYSVYNYTRRVFDYYEAPGPGGTHAGSPPAPRSQGELGAAPERATWKLPAGATKVGEGELPQGRIASLDGADVFSSPVNALALAVVAFVAWRLLR